MGGRKVLVSYSGVGGRVPRYGCPGDRASHGSAACQSLGRTGVERAVTGAVLEAIRLAGWLRISWRRYRARGSLGFDFYWGKSRHNPNYWRGRRTTNAKKFRGGLAALKDWLKKSRSLPLPEIVAMLKRKLQGCWNYYGVIGNSEGLWDYAWNAKRLVYKWLNRRSQRRSCNWTTFDEAWERWKIPSPQIFGKPWPQTRQPRPHPVGNVQPIRVRS